MGNLFSCYKPVPIYLSQTESSEVSQDVYLEKMIFKVPAPSDDTKTVDSVHEAMPITSIIPVPLKKHAESAAEKRRKLDNLIMFKYKIGLSLSENNYVYTFWVPESNNSMKDFVEVHKIPIYEFKKSEIFRDYCLKNKWFNTADKYNRVWESMNGSRSRITNAVLSKFNIRVEISDCFQSRNGTIFRAYQFISPCQEPILRAFTWFSGTLNSSISKYIKQHHNWSFEADIFPINKETQMCTVNGDTCKGNLDVYRFGQLNIGKYRHDNKVFQSNDEPNSLEYVDTVSVDSNENNRRSQVKEFGNKTINTDREHTNQSSACQIHKMDYERFEFLQKKQVHCLENVSENLIENG